jgi:hypothetical protein
MMRNLSNHLFGSVVTCDILDNDRFLICCDVLLSGFSAVGGFRTVSGSCGKEKIRVRLPIVLLVLLRSTHSLRSRCFLCKKFAWLCAFRRIRN